MRRRWHCIIDMGEIINQRCDSFVGVKLNSCRFNFVATQYFSIVYLLVVSNMVFLTLVYLSAVHNWYPLYLSSGLAFVRVNGFDSKVLPCTI